MSWLLVILMSLPSLAWANGETLYVRPAGGSYGTENGTSYANAWDGFINIVYNAANTAGQVDPGDTLYVCGTHTTEQLEIYQDGTYPLRIDFDFDCPDDAGTISTGTSTNYALYTEASYINVHDGTFVGGSISPVSFNTSGGINTADAYIDFYNNTVTTCNNAAGPCVEYYGNYVSIRNNVISDGQQNGIVGQGGRSALISGNTISGISQAAANADTIIITNITDGTIIENNILDHSNVDSKYCVSVSSDTVPGLTTVKGNTCVRRSTDTVGSGYRANSAARFLGNSVFGGQYGIQCAVPAGIQCDVIGNLILSPHEHGVIYGVNSTVTQVRNNTIISPGLEGILSGNNGAGVSLENNIISTTYSQCIDKQTNNVERYNDLYGCSTPVANSNTPTSTGTGTVTTNPNLTTTYRTPAGSTLRRAGVSNGLCLDVRGRPCWVPPDIGAYQATSGDPAATRTVRTP